MTTAGGNEHTRLLPVHGSMAPGDKLAGSLRGDVWTVLRYRASVMHRSGLQFVSYVVELGILMLILLNVILAISDTPTVVRAPTAGFREQSTGYDAFLFVSTMIFSVEYALRLWSCVEDPRYKHSWTGRIKWAFMPMSLIDLLALIPFYLEICFKFMVIPSYRGGLALRSLRLFRVISFLRLERSYNAMAKLRLIFGKKKEELLVVTYLTAVLILTSAIVIYFLENMAQPDVFSSVAVSAWWSVETITSLGYGDVVPKTTAGRFFGAVLAIWGIVLFTIPGAILGSGFIEVMLEKQRQDEAEALTAVIGTPTLDASVPPSARIRRARDTDVDSYVDEDADSPLSPLLSPRMANAMRVEALARQVEDLAVQQQEVLKQFDEQREQMQDIKNLLQQLLGASTPPQEE